MKLYYQCLGGALEVGANCHVLSDGERSLMLDAGSHPKREGLAAMPDFAALKLPAPHAIAVTHCHHDHIGSLPMAMKRYERARAYMSEASRLILKPMLRNSVSVMTRRAREGEEIAFTYSDLDRIERRLIDKPLYEPFTLQGQPPRGNATPTISFVPAGHVLGACGVLVDWGGTTVFFTGDTQLEPQGILDAAELPRECDVLLMEATLGLSPELDDRSRHVEVERFATACLDVLEGGGSVLAPCFALGRTQEMLHIVADLFDRGRLPRVPVFIGGLGRELCEIYDAARFLYPRRDLDFVTRDLRPSVLTSTNIDDDGLLDKPALYLVTSGMVQNSTPSYALARRMLRDERCGIFFVGYVDQDADGYPLFRARRGETVKWRAAPEGEHVACRVETFRFSAHARRKHLIEMAMRLNPRRIVVAHGSAGAIESVVAELSDRMPATQVEAAWPRKVIELA